MVAYACYPSTGEMEAEELEVQVKLQLHSEFVTSLGY